MMIKDDDNKNTMGREKYTVELARVPLFPNFSDINIFEYSQSFPHLIDLAVREARCIPGYPPAGAIDFGWSSSLCSFARTVSDRIFFAFRFASVPHFLFPSPFHFGS
jgi:hypothetical protein